MLTYFDGDRQLRRSRANRLSLTSSIKCSVCVNDYLIIVSTADGTILLLDISHNKIECQTKATFIPTQLSLHPDKVIVVAANEKGLLQGWCAQWIITLQKMDLIAILKCFFFVFPRVRKWENNLQ